MGRNPRSTFLYFPTPLKSLPRPAEVLQSPTTPGEGLREACGGLRRLLREKAWGSLRGVRRLLLGEARGKPARGCGDYSWGRPAEAREGSRRLLLGKAWGKPARGCGDYSWGRPAEAREGLRRLLLERAWGRPRRAAETTFRRKPVEAREGLRRLLLEEAWEACRGWRKLLLESVRRVWG